MQITLAVVGFLGGLAAWYSSADILWLVGALLLISVVPITLILINDILLNPSNDPDSAETEALLTRWGPKHCLRTIVSVAAFVIYLLAALNA